MLFVITPSWLAGLISPSLCPSMQLKPKFAGLFLQGFDSACSCENAAGTGFSAANTAYCYQKTVCTAVSRNPPSMVTCRCVTKPRREAVVERQPRRVSCGCSIVCRKQMCCAHCGVARGCFSYEHRMSSRTQGMVVMRHVGFCSISTVRLVRSHKKWSLQMLS